MPTDLFSKYYDNPTKSYIYADILCNNGTSDDEISFDFNDSNGEITDNNGVLSSLDLSQIHVPLRQYLSDSIILGPNEYRYIRGWVIGDSYCSKSFGRIIGPITKDEDWMYKGMIFFVIKYLDLHSGNKIVQILKATGNIDEEITFIDAINTYFEEHEIPIVTEFVDGYVKFTATKTDYEFWVDHVMFWNSEDGTDIFYYINKWMIENGHSYDYGWDDRYVEGNNIDSNSVGAINVYSSILKKSDYTRLYNLLNCLDTDFNDILEENDVKKIYLFEDFNKYVPSKRYRNGAMLGFIMSVFYPQYNTEDIDTLQKSLKVAHVVDRVQEFYAIPESLLEGTMVCVRKLIDVNDLFQCEYDHDLYNKWMGFYSHNSVYDDWIDSDEIPQVVPEMLDEWEESSVSFIDQGKSIYKNFDHRDQMGIEGYCAYLSKTNQWMTVGQFYGRTTVPDDPENYPEVKNLMTSVVVYNPNPFPVKVKYLAFI
jgi:hypothetical protein